MADEFKLPDRRGVVFWPVGTGDSTTLVLQRAIKLMRQMKPHNQQMSDSLGISPLQGLLPPKAPDHQPRGDDGTFIQFS
jgi:hypothetical protein